MAAGHRKLDNLSLIIDRNTLQQGARSPRPTRSSRSPTSSAPSAGRSPKSTATILHAFIDALGRREARTKPLCVIAHTIKGKGVSFMEDQVGWHHGVPTRPSWIRR